MLFAPKELQTKQELLTHILDFVVVVLVEAAHIADQRKN